MTESRLDEFRFDIEWRHSLRRTEDTNLDADKALYLARDSGRGCVMTGTEPARQSCL